MTAGGEEYGRGPDPEHREPEPGRDGDQDATEPDRSGRRRLDMRRKGRHER